MRNDKEYQLAKAIATYLKLQYPKVIFRFDMAGLNLSKAQAGKNKAIQCGSGYPDLFIAKSRTEKFDIDGSRLPKNSTITTWVDGVPLVKNICGLYLELKAEGEKLWNKKGEPRTPHIAAQKQMLEQLSLAGFKAEFAVGFDDAKDKIDNYLK